ncbi:VapE domain-containing protein [Pontibacter vulgaris]|uniref:VapE domain-containing protein n=1 Tax=Pontibacter vulgaris TaxID=2905679 RepID=UPI001FA7ADAC|nr:VapE domain-containing protein [Pontibacter vulgaris]
MREYLAAGNQEAFDDAKKQLSAFTPSATFAGGRKEKHLNVYAGVVVLDIDKLGEEKALRVKQAACTLPHTFAAFISPSGRGVKLLVKVDSPVAAHKLAFAQVKAHYEEQLQVQVDASGSDVTRLCFLSWDADLYLNPDAATYAVTGRLVFAPTPSAANQCVKPTVEAPQLPKKAASMHQNDAVPGEMDSIYKQCVELTQRRHQFTAGDRNNFVYQLACNLNRYGIAQHTALDLVLADYNYNEQEVRTSVLSAYTNKVEHGSRSNLANGNPAFEPDKISPAAAAYQKIAKLVTVDLHRKRQEAGNEEAAAPATYLDKIEAFLLSRYRFRHNEVTHRQEYCTSDKGKWRQLTDRAESTMLRELLKAQLKVSSASLRSLLSSDFCPLYNPFRSYFKSLPDWDGETDYIQQLATTVTTTDQEQWQYCFKRWFVAMAAGVLDDKVVNHTLIVLSGGQGLGKTTWVLNLVPRKLKFYVYTGEINPKNKDTLQQLSENMLINLDELENLNRSEVGALKEIITKSEIKVRKAYGHHHEKMPRRASFAGSVNNLQFLNDTTGSRRFLCFEVTDIAYRHTVELDKVYAQAYHLYQNGFRYWFDKDEIQQISQSNERFQVRAVEEELLLTWFKHPVENEPILFLTSTQMVAKLAINAKINVTDASVNKLGKALKKHGFERIKRSGVYGYLVRELTWDEVDQQSRKQVT